MKFIIDYNHEQFELITAIENIPDYESFYNLIKKKCNIEKECDVFLEQTDDLIIITSKNFIKKFVGNPIETFHLFVILKNINPELEDEDCNFMGSSEIFESVMVTDNPDKNIPGMLVSVIDPSYNIYNDPLLQSTLKPFGGRNVTLQPQPIKNQQKEPPNKNQNPLDFSCITKDDYKKNIQENQNNKTKLYQIKSPKQTNQINTDKSKNYISFKDSRCSICQNVIINVKYVCLFCDKLILCSHCEPNHTHPVIKFKNNFFDSTKEEVLHQINCFQNPPHIKGFNLFYQAKTQSLKLSSNLVDNHLFMNPNSFKTLKLVLTNNSGSNVPKGKLICVIRNNEELKVSYDENIPEITKKDTYIIPVKISSAHKTVEHKLQVVICSEEQNEDKFLISPYEFAVTVGIDEEEKEVSQYFLEHPEISILPKQEQLIVQKVHQNKLSDKAPVDIYKILKNNKMNINKAIVELTKE